VNLFLFWFMETSNFIDGKTVSLCPINKDHFSLYLKWQHDPEVRKPNCNRAASMTIDQLKKEIERPRPMGPDTIAFEVCYKPENKPVGTCNLHSISWRDEHASIGIAIGETEYWGKGIGTEAIQILLHYGFRELDLHVIFASIYSPNIGSQAAHQKAGLKFEAKLKEYVLEGGKYYDLYTYGITQDEWQTRYKQHP